MRVFAGDRVRTLRHLRGIKPAPAAVALNRSVTQLLAYETGRALPPADVLVRMAELFDVDMNDLFTDDGGNDAVKPDVTALRPGRAGALSQVLAS